VSLCKDLEREIDASKAEVERLKNDFNRLKTLMHQTIWFVDDMIKTHTNGCEHCLKKQGSLIASFKDITEDPQWPIDPTNK
jgi:methyl-accepting chemotaxis protein